MASKSKLLGKERHLILKIGIFILVRFSLVFSNLVTRHHNEEIRLVVTLEYSAHSVRISSSFHFSIHIESLQRA